MEPVYGKPKMRCANDEGLEVFFVNSDFNTSLSISFTDNFCFAQLKATVMLRLNSLSPSRSPYMMNPISAWRFLRDVILTTKTVLHALLLGRVIKVLALSICICAGYVAETALFVHCVLRYLAHKVCCVAFSLRTLCSGQVTRKDYVLKIK